MVAIQVVPAAGADAYKLLRSKVNTKAATWYWTNRSKTTLRHVNSTGYIRVGTAHGVLIAQIHPHKPADLFYLAEKFMGRLVAWLEDDLAAINVQFVAPRKLGR